VTDSLPTKGVDHASGIADCQVLTPGASVSHGSGHHAAIAVAVSPDAGFIHEKTGIGTATLDGDGTPVAALEKTKFQSGVRGAILVILDSVLGPCPPSGKAAQLPRSVDHDGRVQAKASTVRRGDVNAKTLFQRLYVLNEMSRADPGRLGQYLIQALPGNSQGRFVKWNIDLSITEPDAGTPHGNGTFGSYLRKEAQIVQALDCAGRQKTPTHFPSWKLIPIQGKNVHASATQGDRTGCPCEASANNQDRVRDGFVLGVDFQWGSYVDSIFP